MIEQLQWAPAVELVHRLKTAPHFLPTVSPQQQHDAGGGGDDDALDDALNNVLRSESESDDDDDDDDDDECGNFEADIKPHHRGQSQGRRSRK